MESFRALVTTRSHSSLTLRGKKGALRYSASYYSSFCFFPLTDVGSVIGHCCLQASITHGQPLSKATKISASCNFPVQAPSLSIIKILSSWESLCQTFYSSKKQHRMNECSHSCLVIAVCRLKLFFILFDLDSKDI